MQSFKLLSTKSTPKFNDLSSIIFKTLIGSKTLTHNQQRLRFLSSKKNGDEEWNDAWETAWLPEEEEESKAKNTRAPWETTDVHFQSSEETSDVILPLNDIVDPETKAFVEDMTDNWNERRNKYSKPKKQQQEKKDSSNNLYSVENIKRDYRLKKQRIHSGLWMKEIEKLEEAKLSAGGGNDIDKLLDSCSEIFDSTNNELDDTEIPSTSEFKTKPDGWETTSKTQDGNVWEISQREEDILLQEYERRTAYCKFQIASFIKSHIFSRRRPIDGWRYMIEVIGPNARKGKGSVPRFPSLSDVSTQPYKEEKTSRVSSVSPYKRRNTDLLNLLLSKVAEVDSQSDAGTPLIWAAGHGQPDAVKILLEHHANPNAETDDGITPLLSAVAAGALPCAELLVKAGANPNVCAGGASPLLIAAEIGDFDVIDCLIKAGADPNLTDEDGLKPIQVAAARGNRGVVEVLLPLTSPVQTVPDWSIDGLIKHMQAEQQEVKEVDLSKDTSLQKQNIPEVTPEAKKKAQEAKSRGEKAFKRDDIHMAVDAYTQAINFDPSDATLLSNRSLCYMRLGQPEQALTDAKACRELRPDWHKACYREGAALRLLQRFEEAANAFYEGVQLDPDSKELAIAFREAVDAGRKFHAANQQKS